MAEDEHQRAAHATPPPSPATAGGGPAWGTACVCRHGRVAIAARQARAVPLERRDRPPLPRPAKGLRRAAHACAAIGTSRSKRARHAPCRSRDAIALPSHGRGRPAPGGTCWCRSRRPAIAARRARTVPLARHHRPPQPRPVEGQRCAVYACAASGASLSQRDKHAQCCSRNATDLPSHGRRRASAGRHMCVGRH